ncbi:MAG: MATE family efflux transporter [Fimbriimonadaceae bacterium]|nr:MATE family efflux transporter [Fimbriimonadaceae bacterium]
MKATAAAQQNREALLTGPLVPALLRLAWPTAAGAALQGLVSAVDVFMVGHLGEQAVGAVTVSRQAIMLLLVAGSAVGMGCGTLVAQAIGAGDRERANHVLTQAMLTFSAVLVLVMAPLGWLLTPPLLRWLTAGNAAVVDLGTPYMRVVLLSSVFTVLGFGASSALRGAGDTKTPLRIALWANLLHVPANWIAIFGLPALGLPAYGLMGAAYGTVVARCSTNLLLLWWLARGRLVIRFRGPRHWRLDFPVLLEMAKIGIPASLSSIVLNLHGTLVLRVLARTDDGGLALAAYGLANSLRNFGTWMVWGLSDATLTMVGQNIGARQRRRARAAGFAAAWVSAGMMLGLGLLLAAVGPLIFPNILRESDPQRFATVCRLAEQFLLVQIIALPFLGVGMAIEGALRGAGDALAAMLNNALSFLLIGLPVCALLAWHEIHLGFGVTLPAAGLGPLGVWIGMSVAMAARGVSMLLKWRRTRWRARLAVV